MVIDKDIRAHDFLRGGPKWRIILGSKGQPFINPGYLWAPYIISTDVAVLDDFTPRTNIMSRYGNKIINGNYYSRITVNEIENGVQLPTVNRMSV